MKKNISQSVARLSKLAFKENYDFEVHKCVAGAYYVGGETQITNSYWLFIHNKKLNYKNIKLADTSERILDLNNFIKGKEFEPLLLDDDKVIYDCRYRVLCKEDDGYFIGGAYYNPQYIIDIAMCVKNARYYIEHNAKYPMLMIKNDETMCFLLPMKRRDNNDRD